MDSERTRWVSFLVVLCMVTAPPAWAYRDKKVEDAVVKAEDLLAKSKSSEDEAKAIAVVQKAAQSVKTGEAYVALGRIQEKASPSIDDAALSFEKARELGSGDAEVLTAVALFELQAASAKRALETAKAAVAAPGAGPEAKAALALALTASNEASAGLKTAEEAVAAAPGSALAHEAKGQALFLNGHTAAALASLRKAEELDPRSVNALVKLSAVLAAEGKNAEAEATAKKALAINKNSAAAMAAKAVAVVGVDVKRWNEAISDAQQGAFLNARSAFVHLSVGKVFEAAGNYEQASQSYTKALEADPGYVTARVALIGVLNQRGEAKRARTDIDTLIAQTPGSGEGYLLRAKDSVVSKDFKAAEPDLVKAVELLPRSADSRAMLATLRFMAGKDEEARELFSQAVALKPDAPAQWRMDYALLLARLEQTDEALVEIAKVVNVPEYRDPVGFVNLGYILRRTKPPKAKEAEEAYEKALKLDPGSAVAAQAKLGLGWALAADKEHRKAIETFTQVVELDSKLTAEAYNGVGWSHLYLNELAPAEAAAAKARDAGRADPTLTEWIARLKAKKTPEIDPPVIDDEMRWWRDIDEDLRDVRPTIRIRAISKLSAKPGKPAADRLIAFVYGDEDYPTREKATLAVLSMGKHAAPAVQYIKANLNLSCEAPMGVATKAEIEREITCEDLKRTSRQVLQKLGSQ